MAHVQIKAPHPESGGAGQVIVDGVDMTDHVLAENFAIDIGDSPLGRPPTVTMTIDASDGLDVEFPDAVVKALAVSNEEYERQAERLRAAIDLADEAGA